MTLTKRGKRLHAKLPKGRLPRGVTRTNKGYKISGEALKRFKRLAYGD